MRKSESTWTYGAWRGLARSTVALAMVLGLVALVASADQAVPGMPRQWLTDVRNDPVNQYVVPRTTELDDAPKAPARKAGETRAMGKRPGAAEANAQVYQKMVSAPATATLRGPEAAHTSWLAWVWSPGAVGGVALALLVLFNWRRGEPRDEGVPEMAIFALDVARTRQVGAVQQTESAPSTSRRAA